MRHYKLTYTGPKILLILILTISIEGCVSTSEDYQIPEIEVVEIDSVQWLKLEEAQKIDDFFKHEGQIYCGEVAYNTYPLKNVDIKNFEVLAGTNYARDTGKLYYPIEVVCVDGTDWGNCHANEYVMKGADPKSFKYIGEGYSKDKSKVYFNGREVAGADQKTFHITEGILGKDCTNTYLYGQPIAN